jgi:hypothetical protein
MVVDFMTFHDFFLPAMLKMAPCIPTTARRELKIHEKRDASQKDTEINCLKIDVWFTDGEIKTAIT